jgi:hypothetical protein
MDDKILQAAQAAAEREAQERQRAEEDEARRGRVAAAWEQVRKLRQNERDTAGGTMRWRDMPERAECWRDLAGSIVNLAAVIEAEGLRQSFEDLCTGYGAMLDTQERLALRYAFDTYRIAFTGDVDAVAKRLFAAISTVGANPVSGCFREHFIWVLLEEVS